LNTPTASDVPLKKIVFGDNQIAQSLFGEHGQNLKQVEERLEVRIHVRGSAVSIAGSPEMSELAGSLLEQLYELARDGYPVFPSDVDHATRLVKSDPRVRIKDFFLDTVVISARKKPIVPRTIGQKIYVEAIRRYEIVFGIGPAGTGKTYLAMAMAVASLLRKEVNRIVLTRPAVEAGEKLGFLPGDLAEKVNPYLRPLYDALNDMMDFERAGKLIEKGVVEVAPLAFMRGRTLNDAFVILDEAQNTTSEQMKMFLTRLGLGSRAVITGDVTQIDLPSGRASGLIEAREVLAGLPRLRFVEFTKEDVVRHPLVQDVVHAYELWDARREQERNTSRALREREALEARDAQRGRNSQEARDVQRGGSGQEASGREGRVGPDRATPAAAVSLAQAPMRETGAEGNKDETAGASGHKDASS